MPSTHWWFKRAKRAKTRSNCAKRARNPSNEYRNQVFSQHVQNAWNENRSRILEILARLARNEYTMSDFSQNVQNFQNENRSKTRSKL